MESDKEIKFISSANTQIKFYNKNIHPDVFRKIERLLDFLEIPISRKIVASSVGSPTRHDIYFDHEWRLARGLCSLSIRAYSKDDRERPSSHALTAKFDEAKEYVHNGTVVLSRNEVHADIDAETAARITQQGMRADELRALLKGVDLPVTDACLLVEKGRALIRRSLFDIQLGDTPHQISVDKFYFHNPGLNRYSETYTEIEIESKTLPAKYDPRIQKLVELMQIVFDIAIQPVSKYQRFRTFSISRNFQALYFVGWDIASYSTQRSWGQKQIVQRFHKIIKDSAAASGFIHADDLISISIGDGAILAADTDWSNIESLIQTVHERVLDNNREDKTRHISYRTAVHWGSVFPFTDLNEAINIAGEGINMLSRLLGMADPGRPLVSAKAYDQILDGSSALADHFEKVDTQLVKHGVKIDAYWYTRLAR